MTHSNVHVNKDVTHTSDEQFDVNLRSCTSSTKVAHMVTQTSDLEEALIDLNIKFPRLSEENTQLRSQLDRALGSSCMTTCQIEEHFPLILLL